MTLAGRSPGSGAARSPVIAGAVDEEPSARDWIAGLLAHGVGALDLPLLLRTQQAWAAGDTETALREHCEIAVVTNDIYTREDAEFLCRHQALSAERIRGVETGGCPHTAIREDASMNLAAVDDLTASLPGLEVVFIESGGDNLSATFSPELSDLTLYVIDVCAGDKIPRKGGPGVTRSDLLVINKTDLAPHVGASLEMMERCTRAHREERPFQFTDLKRGEGVREVVEFIVREGMLAPRRPAHAP